MQCLTLLLFHLQLTLSSEIYHNAGHLQQYTPWHQLLIWLQAEVLILQLGFGSFPCKYHNVLIYEEQYEINASNFFSSTTITMKFTHTIHTPFKKLQLLFHTVSIINIVFSKFAWDAVCRSHKTLCWSIGALHTHCVSTRRHPQNSVFRLHPLGSQKGGSWRVLNQECRKDEG